LAALGIVVHHYGVNFHASPWPSLFGQLYTGGWLLVDFFFVLSGFVLARTYWTPSRCRKIADNVWERIARLYPLHFCTLFAVLAGELVSTWLLGAQTLSSGCNDPFHFVLNLLLLQISGWHRGFSFNVPAWSISTEFIVNLMFFAVILLPRRLALLLCIAVALGSRGLPGYSGPLDPLVMRTALGFFTGVLLQRIYAFAIKKSWWRPSHWADAIAVGALVLLAALFVNPALRGAGVVDWLGGKTTLFAILIASVPLSITVRRLLCWPPLVYLGEISYSIYLVHFPLQIYCAIFFQAARIPAPYAHPWFLGVFLLVTIACASLTYAGIERPGKHLFRSIFAPAPIPAALVVALPCAETPT